VSRPATTYTTSAATSSCHQWATDASGSRSSKASVAFTAPSSTGTRTGSSSTGNSSSRVRTCAVMAAKSEPTAAMPSVPSTITSARPGSAGPRSTLKKSVKSASTMASTTSISARLAASLPTYTADLSPGASSSASQQSLSRSTRNVRPSPSTPLRMNPSQSTPGSTAARRSRSGPSVNWKTNRSANEKKRSALSVSFDRRSTTRSFQATMSARRA